ncbi:hypothetical protein D5085_05790 [Ectothiorhodospiraceae bacterium BW-2]|nr:hypothetical protein D5085_05790 [Ectothiorhodospiraceae bacterium BW-2]
MVTEPLIYPWQKRQWQQLQQQFSAKRVPHAIHFVASHGDGVAPFALQVAQGLICRATIDLTPCHQCDACRYVEAGHSPALWLADEDESGGRPLLVDQIRQLTEWMHTRQTGTTRIAWLDGAEMMLPAAANALLKSLEEPPQGVVLLLFTPRPEQLPLTLASRCQRVSVKPTLSDEAAVVSWLQPQLPQCGTRELSELLRLANGQPLLALEYGQGRVAAEWPRFVDDFVALWQQHLSVVEFVKRQQQISLIDWLEHLAAELIREQSGFRAGQGVGFDVNIADRLDISAQALHRLLVALGDYRRRWQKSYLQPLQQQALLLDWLQQVRGVTATW